MKEEVCPWVSGPSGLQRVDGERLKPPKESQGSARSGRYFNDMRADI